MTSTLPNTPRTVCVTGGAGFIGSHLSDAFAARGDRVIVIDDLSSGCKANLPAKAELHELDIRSPQAAALLAQGGVDVLVHQAAQMDVRRSVADPTFDASINIVGSLNLFEAARRGGVQQILFASTGGAIYGEQARFPADEDDPLQPVSPYGVSKLAVERYLFFYHQAYGLDVTCLRYANVYGERQSPHGEAGVVAIFLDLLLAGKQARINGDGEQTRDYIHVSDVVRANVGSVGRTGFNIYNVGTSVETSVVALYEHLTRILGLETSPEYGPAKPGEQRRSVIDASRGRQALALPEPCPLPEGLARTAQWFGARSADEDCAKL